MLRLFAIVGWLALIAVIAGFFYLRAAPTGTDPYVVYQESLARLASVAPPAAGSDAEAAALAQITRYFSDMSTESVAAQTAATYAEDALLSDTLAVVRGREAITDYYLKSAENAAGIEVRMVDILRSGDDFYLRWTMRIEHPSLADGAPLESAGMSHMRLNAQGQVVLHYDFWDSSSSFFEHLPGIGGALRRIKARLH